MKSGIVVLLVLGGCTVSSLDPEGRPCSSSVRCGPGFSCDPATEKCVARSDVDAAARDLGPDAAPRDLPPVSDAADSRLPDSLQPDSLQPDMPKDSDNDTVPDSLDNCPGTANTDQKDTDQDNLGDACDPDIDGDTLPNDRDPRPTIKDTVYYYNEANKMAGDLSGPGHWTNQGPARCQDKMDNDYWAELKVNLPSSDYVVETRFSVQGTNPSSDPNLWHSAGLFFREASGDGYECLLDLKNYRLVLAKFTQSSFTALETSPDNSTPKTGPYRMRISAKGNKLTCELVTATPVIINTTHSQYGWGDLGFITDYTHICFDYLTVTAAP